MKPQAMVRILLAALALLLGGGQLAAQTQPQQPAPRPAPRTYSQADLWDRGSDRISFRLANISFPNTLGTTRLDRSMEASREGQGLDNALQYLSSDRQVFVTVYVYAPAYPDAGLTAFMTDYAIHVSSTNDLRVLRSAVVAAGGRDGVAIRTDYAGAREQRLASSAAFLRVDHWIVKLRVSGPESRRAEVEAAMTALLQGIRFDANADKGPRPILPVAQAPCPAPAGAAAQLLPLNAAEATEDALMSHVLGREVTARLHPEPAGEPYWCRSGSLRLGDGIEAPVLSARHSAAGDDTRRSVLVALLVDNGTMLEVVQRTFRGRTRFVVNHHQIGRTLILGAYDRMPTLQQLRDVLTGADREGGRVRASVTYQASGDSEVTLNIAPERPPAQPRT